MCGFVGISGPNEKYEARFAQALSTIEHRGPDGYGYWRGENVLFGHRRLAIIDPDARSGQPMVDSETGTVIVFNGEIYNYKELGKELQELGHRFQTNGDTEVILKGYRQWGTSIFQKTNGMWALAIWDKRKNLLILCRDRFGEKPLYYHQNPQNVIFASEPKALHALKPSLIEPDSNALVQFFAHSRSHSGDTTFFRSIKSLPPATYAIINPRSNELAVHRYWDYPKPSERLREQDSDFDEFEHLFEDAVRIRLRSDVPIGLTLSGGLDSTAILATASDQSDAIIKCFTAVYSEQQVGEYKWAKKAAEHRNVELIPVESSTSTWLSSISETINFMDSPGFSPAVVPTLEIMKQARREGVLVLMEGQGADELLGGYTHHAAAHIVEQMQRRQFLDAAWSYGHLQKSFGRSILAAWVARLTFPVTFKKFSGDARDKLFQPYDKQSSVAVDKNFDACGLDTHYLGLKDLLWRDHSTNILPALLHYGDSLSMAQGVESRLPFLDHRLVEWTFRSNSQFFRKSESKYHLRKYLRKRGFHAIAGRRKKEGYPTPIGNIIDETGMMYLKETLSFSNHPIWSTFDRHLVEVFLAEKGLNKNFHIYKLISLSLWLEGLKDRLDGYKSSSILRNQKNDNFINNMFTMV